LTGAIGEEALCPPEQLLDADVVYESYVDLKRRRREH
jgi:hypothetical protein